MHRALPDLCILCLPFPLEHAGPVDAASPPSPSPPPLSHDTKLPHRCSLTAQLTRCESSAEAVASVLTSTEMAFSPRLPGLTKLMGKFTKDGEWRKALAIFDTLPSIGLHPDTTITNAAITACDKGTPPLHVNRARRQARRGI